MRLGLRPPLVNIRPTTAQLVRSPLPVTPPRLSPPRYSPNSNIQGWRVPISLYTYPTCTSPALRRLRSFGLACK